MLPLILKNIIKTVELRYLFFWCYFIANNYILKVVGLQKGTKPNFI